MDKINIFILIAGTISLLVTLFIYIKKPKDKVVSAFLLLIINSSLWTIAMSLYRAAVLKDELIFFSYLLYFVALFLPISFLNMVRHLSNKADKINKIFFTLFVFSFVYAAMAFGLFDNFQLISDVYRRIDSSEPVILLNSLPFYFYAFLIITPFSLGFFHIYKLYKKSKDESKKILLFFIGVGVLVPASVSMITNLILPYLQYFELNWAGQFSAAVAPLVVLYGIYKYKIFDFELFLAEILVIILVAQSFLYLLQSKSTPGLIASFLSLLLTLFMGLWLLRNIEEEHKAKNTLQNKIIELKKLNEHVKKISQKKSEFLSIATHQLRAPLTVMKGQLSLLLENSYGQVPDYLKKPLKKIYDSVGRMTTTVDEFLSVSRIEQGKMKYNFKEVDLKTLLNSVYDELKEFAIKEGLDFRLSFCNEVKGTKALVYADYDKLRHVLFNLVENAIKYTKNGFVYMNLCTQNGKYIRIEIKDSGVGIDPSELKSLFSKFVRSKNVYGVNVAGTGLGLYIAREIMHAHNGRIWAQSKGVGKGASFFIELPAVKKYSKN